VKFGVKVPSSQQRKAAPLQRLPTLIQEEGADNVSDLEEDKLLSPKPEAAPSSKFSLRSPQPDAAPSSNFSAKSRSFVSLPNKDPPSVKSESRFASTIGNRTTMSDGKVYLFIRVL